MSENFNEYFKRHNGKIVKIDRISYKIKYEEHKVKYPYVHTSVSISLIPINKRSDYYMKVKRKLGDDWVVDARDLHDDGYTQIVQQLGDLK